MAAGKGKFSSIYRIYRRIRYIRYVRRMKRSRLREEEALRRNDQKERDRIIREQLRSEKISDREKNKHERREMLVLQKQQEQQSRLDPHVSRSLREEQKARTAFERQWQVRRRRRLLKVYRKACMASTIRSASIFNPRRIPRLISYIRENRHEAAGFFVISFHSTLLFVAAYLMVFMISQLTSSISGLFYDYKSVVYHYDVLWLVKPAQWFGDSVKMVYASGPVVMSLAALFLAIVFSYLRTGRGLTKLFILWSFLHGFTAFLGALLIGSLFGRGIGHAIIWSYVSDTSKVIYSIISITALLMLGIITTRSFLISANSYYPNLERHRQRQFVWAQVIVPFVAGNIAIQLLMAPHFNLYNTTVALCLGIVIMPTALGYRFVHDLYFEEGPVRLGLRPVIIISSLLFIIVYRVIFGMGIPIG